MRISAAIAFFAAVFVVPSQASDRIPQTSAAHEQKGSRCRGPSFPMRDTKLAFR
jgi:hypothetical protein